MVSLIITAAAPDSADAILLIDELEGVLAPMYPAESRHGLSVAQLLAQGVAFFLIHMEGAPAGCGGVKFYGTDYGELKRMYVRPQFRGRGFARAMLDHLEYYTLAHGISTLRLETGIHQHEAIGLYESFGFTRIPPFGEYKPDPLSVFFEKRICDDKRYAMIE